MLVKFDKVDHSKLDNKDLPVLSKSQSEVSITSLARVESWRIFTFAYEENKTPAFYDLEEALDKWRSMGKVSIRAGPNKLSPVLDRLLLDENRAYMYKVMHLHTWQFMMLADRLKDLLDKLQENINYIYFSFFSPPFVA